VTDICYPSANSFLSVTHAQDAIQQAIDCINDCETLPLPQCLGRVLAESIFSPINLPPERNAAMDGYAIFSGDIKPEQSFSLKQVGTSWAGKPFIGEVQAGECIRIFTGAVVPDFYDSVIAQEQVDRQGSRISFAANTLPGNNIRLAGSDLAKGDLLLAAQKRLSATDLALLSSAGISQITVKRKLKIAFFSTGDELCAVGEPLASGQIYDSNRYALSALLTDNLIAATDLGIVADNPDLLESVLRQAAKTHDVIISSGGASVGDADYVKQVLERCGQVNFWKIAIKPGKPLTFGRIGTSWFFGLPGNPVAVLVTFEKFVRPALLKLAGAPVPKPLQLKACCTTVLKKSPGRQEYQRGILSQTQDGELRVTAVSRQDSHQLSVASRANCFIVLAADCAGVEAGQSVTVEPFDVSL